MKLVVVESPVKGKTISKFLGPQYKVVSSYGHIRDLPKKEIGVDVAHGFSPTYIVPATARKQVKLLKEQTSKAELVILGVDEDREGEAIGWHLTQILNLNGQKPYQRIVFHEITKPAIEQALNNPRKIDMDLVDAQQARRILDRLVGYKLSPFLWKKIARGLSAGRVQSVAVRLVAEREREIEDFKPQEYWSIAAELLKKAKKGAKLLLRRSLAPFLAQLIKKDNKTIAKLGIKKKKEAEKVIKELKGAEYKVAKIEKKEVKRNPLPPFTTSTLQQESWKRFRLPAKFTMRLAQNLYEKGLTSYHRTDSLNLSQLSLLAAKKFIVQNYGKDYWAGFLRKYKTKAKAAQEAHEAIRPTYPSKKSEAVKKKYNLNDKEFKLYDLIWRRFIACQMAQARLDSTAVDILAKKYTFRSTGQILRFDGFLKVYPIKFEETDLPPLEKDEILKLLKLTPSQHFTQPPARYTEASLIKALEKNGIGRPSTYAPILSTVQERNYIEKDEKKRFCPTELGITVNDLLTAHFPQIVDIKFTAKMEQDLDRIAQGKQEWVPTIRDFYTPFAKKLDIKYKEVSKMVIETKEKCEKCGKPMLVRMGRFGKFLACSGFPDCKNTKPLASDEKKLAREAKATGEKCEKCGSPMVLRKGRYGEFLGCSKYPECKNIKNIEKKIGLKCRQCNEGEIVEKRTRNGKKFWGCNRWPDCQYATWEKPKKD